MRSIPAPVPAQLSTFGIATPCPDIFVSADVHPSSLLAAAMETSNKAIADAQCEAIAIDICADEYMARRVS